MNFLIIPLQVTTYLLGTLSESSAIFSTASSIRGLKSNLSLQSRAESICIIPVKTTLRHSRHRPNLQAKRFVYTCSRYHIMTFDSNSEMVWNKFKKCMMSAPKPRDQFSDQYVNPSLFMKYVIIMAPATKMRTCVCGSLSHRIASHFHCIYIKSSAGWQSLGDFCTYNTGSWLCYGH